MTLHVECSGSGPALVLLHGWAMHGGIFTPLRAHLLEHFTVHSVDLPGHGGSRELHDGLDVADCARRVAEQVPERAIWLGWSLGGLIALEGALARPDRVRALALVAASPRFVTAPDWPHGVDVEVFRRFATDLERDYPATLHRFLALEVLGSRHPRRELRFLHAQFDRSRRPSARVLEQGLALLADSDRRADLARLTVPSLWIAGERDRLVPAAAMAWSASVAPGGRLLSIAGAAHAPFLSAPGPLAEALRRLARETT